MKILFLTHYFSPHIGGVEKHVLLLSKELITIGHEVTVLTEKFEKELIDNERQNNIDIIRLPYPKRKFIGLFYIWYFIWKKRNLIVESDVIHIHDVFIWYIPFRFLFPTKDVFITIHGLEWGDPFSKNGIFQKKIAVLLSKKSIGVGKFLEKYIRTKFNLIIYGATNISKINKKKKNKVVFVGRLSKDTGIIQFLKWLEKHKKFKVDFVGDGDLIYKCEKFGTVHGFVNPETFLKYAEYVVPGGYLACLEAFAHKCKVKVFWNNNLKKNYWQMSPMYKFIKSKNINEAYDWAQKNSWKKLSDDYIELWKA